MCIRDRYMGREDGKPLQGLAGEKNNNLRDCFVLFRENRSNYTQGIFYVELVCTDLGGNFNNGNMCDGLNMHKRCTLEECHIATFNREAWDLYWDFKVIYESAKQLDTSKESRADQALLIGNEIVNTCVPKDKSTYAPSRAVARRFFATKNPGSQHTVYAVGHCHIDMAWLWPFSETRRKGGRSWSSQTELMKQYEPFSFCASSSGLYEWVEHDYPKLFEEIKQYVVSGNQKFFPVGGSYLEFDGYLPSGESMARQMLYGQRFFKHHFGKYCNTFFLPDTFGYSAQLPQIIKKAGMRYFLTQKLSWSRYNKFPHSSFNWKGIDGTSVLTHFPPADNYCSQGHLDEVLKSQTNFKDKGRSNVSLMLFGIGDGGGGPLPQHIEQLERMKDVDGIPKVVLGKSVDDFFDALNKDRKNLMTWDGELYLELHNGSYTTMANNKKGNRLSELLIRDAELFSTLVCILEKKNAHYDWKQLGEVWRKIMLFQFHDVLPGTCIGPVYDVTDKEYPLIIKYLTESIEKSVAMLADKALAGHLLDYEFPEAATANTAVVFNSLSFPRKDHVLEWEKDGAKVYSKVEVPGVGCAIYPVSVLEKCIIDKPFVNVEVKENIEIESPKLRVVLSKGGRVLSVRDKETKEYNLPDTEKEVIGPWKNYKGGNILLLHDDVPIYWDAWDLWIYYQETATELLAHSHIIEKKNHQVKVIYSYKISDKSTLTQAILVNGLTKRIDFETNVDWHETHKVLRSYFPLNIRADSVVCDIQSGNLRRPTTANTSWEMAKHEICSHKFVDMSEAFYGVALMNNCKYGYSAQDNVLGLSLLKSSKGPYDKADMGKHDFTYSLYPHKFSLPESDVAEESFKLNVNVYEVWKQSTLADKKEVRYIDIQKPKIILDALKLDEEKRNTVILRVHEDGGSLTSCPVKFGFGIDAPVLVNILEEKVSRYEIVESDGKVVKEESEMIASGANDVHLKLKPFDIVTIKFGPLLPGK
eukprot:TRINITY_DN1150_c0_g2_i1.p1 TRINITY_DN1150_c0_g2~~TRINITY_DN1150_c0_g2_i1.p1  ORF type:complete len:982 (-),score=326.77 TRINITY_DN1150_c0_g2_i1:100-3045(-)